jgi:hypothetical protein
MCSVSIELDASLLKTLQPGDQIEMRRKGTGDIGISNLRDGELLWAVGAVTTVSLGPMVRLRGGPAVNLDLEWPRGDTWLEVSIGGGHTCRLRDGDEIALGDYQVRLARAFKDGIPGQYENAAISRGGVGYEGALRATQVLGQWNAGLTMKAW